MALRLDGKDDCVDCGSDGSLSFSDGTTDRPFSISLWARTDNWSGFAVVSKGGEYWIDHNNAFRTRLWGDGGFAGCVRGGRRGKDEWVHLAVTYDGSGKPAGIVMYVSGSGASRAEANGAYKAMKPGKGKFVIGRCWKWTCGAIDDYKVFDHALTPVEVKKLAGILFELDVEGKAEVLPRQQGQLTAEVTVSVTNLSPQPRKANLRASLSVAEQTQTAERDGILCDPGAHRHTIAVPVPAAGPAKLSVALEDAEQKRVVCSRRVSLTLDYQPLKVDVLRPHYQNAAFAGQQLDEVALEVHAAVEPAKIGEYAFEFLLKSIPETILRRTQRVDAEATVVTIPLPSLVEGSYRMEGRLVHRPSGRVVGEWEDVLRKLPPRTGEARFDEDWVCWVDGERFLPFGIFSPWWPKGIWDAIDLGCNAIECVAVRLTDEEMPYLDRLHQAGMKIVVSPFPRGFQGLRGMTPELAQELRSQIRQRMNHPAILAWYTGNEPRPPHVTPKTMKRIHDIITHADPYHPTLVINHRLEYIPLYIDAQALAMPDPYPYFAANAGWERPRYPTHAVREAVRASRGRKPVWALLQGHNMTLFGRSTSRAPHFGDLRNQLYQAAIAGARGFFWYCRYWIEPHVEIGLAYLAKEVAALRNAFLASESPHAFAPASGDLPEDLHLSRREVGKHVFLLVVSSPYRPRELTFRAAALADGPLFVVGEARQVEARGGEFVDTFVPHDTHVYTTNERLARSLNIAAVLKEIETAYNPPLKPGNLTHKSRGTKVEVSPPHGHHYPPPEHIIDGSKWSSWHNAPVRKEEAPPQWVDLVFAKPERVSRVVIDSNLSHLEIQRPDGEAWITLAEARLAAEDKRRDVQTIRFPEVETTRLRVLLKAAKGVEILEHWFPQIWEIEAYHSAR